MIDHRADIYSMGIILYHMVVGRPPFEISSSDIISLIYKHLETIPPAPSEINPNIPQPVEAVIMRALSKDPAHRYNDVRQMADELDIALGRKTGSTFGTPTPRFVAHMPSTRPSAKSSRLPLIAAIVSVVVIALIAGLIIVTQNQLMPLPKAVVQIGEEGAASDVVPTAAQIATAKRALGDGFIAYVTCNQTSEYHATQAREMGDLARQAGLSYRVYDSDTDEYQQLTQIERARTDGAKAIILCPLNAQLLDGSLKSIQDAGIPLVLLSSDIPGYGGVQLVGDEFLMGKKPGELAGQIIRDEMGGQANVIILDYPELPHIVTRANGLEEGVLEFAPEAQIIGRYLGATREFAEASVNKLIDEGIEFDVILSINDAGSFGAIAALEKAGIASDSVIITSVDAEVQAREYIRDGRFIRGSVDPGRAVASKTAIDIVIQLLAGATVPEQIFTPPGDMITREVLEAQGQLQ
jgi:ABC-type sugar transport system substrate-binding protein